MIPGYFWGRVRQLEVVLVGRAVKRRSNRSLYAGSFPAKAEIGETVFVQFS